MENWSEILIKAMLAWMLSAGLMFSLCDGLGLSYTAALLISVSGIGVGWHLWMRYGKHGLAVGGLGLAVLCGVLIVYSDLFLNGMLSLYNEASETLGRAGICQLTEYTLLSGETADRDAEFFLCVIGMAAGWCVSAAADRWKKITAAVSLILAAAFLCIHAEARLGWILSGAGSVFLSIYISYTERNVRWTHSRSAAVILAGAAVSLCLGAAVYAGMLLLPEQEYEEAQVVKQIRSEVLQRLDDLRYKKQQINTLPKGNLKTAETWEATEQTALRVTMSEPDSLYLRGYIGSVYDTDHWEALSSEVYYEERDLFYWLEQWNVSGAVQLSALRERLEDEELSDETVTIEIENVNADSEYKYLPYEFVCMENEEKQDALTDQAAKAGGLFGKRNYTYRSYQNLVKDFPRLAALSYLYRKERPQDLYTEAESYYNVFVYDQYTRLPDRVRTLLGTELGYAGGESDAHADYRSVITKLRKYFEEHITYGNYAEKLPQGEDFLSFFLTESKIGNSVHYATAAALMFRYYGIPARYVEGYLITPQDAAQAQPGEVIELTGSSGHAWTEIYVDGLGWVPVEMTPEYLDVMEQPDLSIGLQTDSSVVITPPKTQMQEEEKHTSENLKEHLSQIFLNLGKWILYLLIGFDLCCLLLFLYLLIRRIAANRKRYRQFHQKDSKKAVCSMTGYMLKLIREADSLLPEDVKARYAQAYQIGQKAAFSLHSLSEEERKEVESSRKYLLKAVKKEKGWYDRWILKYIERLY